ncbi:hypothetical protein AQJ67_05060 [Streptomyces caeruleatus]|uniref:Uncharacterized protein n=1 Tax=Streptomyces caeruleatus TaxID=661399 RepID=A0A117RRN7_9ACTN|nr:hypothetical protein AQJ67_05060 [Streptomyces caeruleatus]
MSTTALLADDGRARPLALYITAGQAGDAPASDAVMARIRVPRIGLGRPRTRPEVVLADRPVPPAQSAGIYDAEASGPSTPSPQTRSDPVSGEAGQVAGRPASIRRRRRSICTPRSIRLRSFEQVGDHAGAHFAEVGDVVV